MLAIYDSRKTKRIAQVSCWLESCNAHMLEVLNYMAMSNYHYLNIKLACHKKCLIGSMKLWATADIKKSVYWWAVVCSYLPWFKTYLENKSLIKFFGLFWVNKTTRFTLPSIQAMLRFCFVWRIVTILHYVLNCKIVHWFANDRG